MVNGNLFETTVCIHDHVCWAGQWLYEGVSGIEEVVMGDVAIRPSATTGNGAREYTYQAGFGNEFASEAVPGALPAGRNSPQRAPLGLFAEQLSGTAFTQPRAVNRRTWVYRIMPSAAHQKFSRIGSGTLRGTNPAVFRSTWWQDAPTMAGRPCRAPTCCGGPALEAELRF